MANNSTAQGIGSMPQIPEVEWEAFLAAEHLQQPSPSNYNRNGFLNNLNATSYQPNISYSGFETDQTQTYEDSTYMTGLPQPPQYPSGSGSSPFDCQPTITPSPFQAVDYTGGSTIPPAQGHQLVPNNSTSSPQSAMATIVYAPTKHVAATRPKGKRSFNSSSAADAAPQQPRPKSRKLYNAVDHLQPTADQDEVLQTKLRQWRRDSHFPTDKELKAIASACDLPLLKVAMWYGANLQVEQDPNAPTGLQVPQQAGNTDRGHETMIRTYLNDASRKQCSAGKGQGKYRCTWRGCSYSTDKRYEWERHEESKQPQHFWICVECNNNPSITPFITHRSDKIFPHLKSMHEIVDESRKNNVRDKSKVDFDAPFIDPCHFVLPASGETCGHHCTSWKERNDHWIAHFEADAAGSDHGLPSGPGADEDGDQGGHKGHPGDRDSSNDNGSSSGSPGPSRHQNNYNSSWPQHGSGSSAGGASFYSASSNDTKPVGDSKPDVEVSELHKASATRQIVLLDVHEHKLVHKGSTERYLALKYDPKQMPSFKHGEKVTLDVSQGSMSPGVEALSTIMRSAIELTREMGFRYLWTELNEQSSLPTATRDKYFQAAVLIIVMGFKPDAQQPIWHFTCDYTHLAETEKWVRKRHWFRHVTPLGQGAHGFVDRVELTTPTGVQASSKQPVVFARKIILRDRTNRNQRACYVQEIEIMQKLDHPHIAKFEAAYYDRTAFNILMSPVAECDMRHFLNHPEDFESQLEHIRRWFMSLAEALAYMHNLNCRHKDIKPANILISNNNVLLTDFGTAKEWNDIDNSTTAGDAFMTPKYSAPEVAARQDRGRAADVFSLGCVFLEMLAVYLRISLEDFHHTIQLTDHASGRKGPYHDRTVQLQEWLCSREQECTEVALLKAVDVTKKMIITIPQERPTARQVTEQLCSKRGCHGLSQEVTCHCCSDQHDEVSSDLQVIGRPNSAAQISAARTLSFAITRSLQGRPSIALEEHVSFKIKFESGGREVTILPDELRQLHGSQSEHTHRQIQNGRQRIDLYTQPSAVVLNAVNKTMRCPDNFKLPAHVRRVLDTHWAKQNPRAATKAMQRRLKAEYDMALNRGRGEAGAVNNNGSLITPSIMQAPAYNNSQSSLSLGSEKGANSQSLGPATQALKRHLKTEYAMALDRERPQTELSKDVIME